MAQKHISSQSKQRNQCRLARNALSSQQRIINSQEALQQLINSDLLNNAFKIAVFISQDGELSTKQLIKELWEQDKEVYLPVILEKNNMQFAKYMPPSQLTLNKFKIPEPKQKHFMQTKKLDLIFMPLSCFDTNGNRIGMGGGFYDRSLQFKQQPQPIKPFLIGWAHQCQQTPLIQSEDWDIPLDALITETNLYRFKHH